ncbi:hypothetical protein NYR30_03525 [Gallibacterium salpingitidis]|uniref:ACP-like domain-containing protein n=1 Tax=Gallibacterium salpingitidis TaxID=505341 RepID=UPI00266ED9EC|nr:hypothetical protein [Gallibacterium salpingitidis]WKT00370.1 hypothetical protein NYR30_03525 [Gallibacterium salpingitidis]
MKLKTFSTLFLAACLQTGAFNVMAASNDFSVQFPKGETAAELNGTIKGNDVDRYTFYAKKGQIATLETLDKDPQIQFALAYANKSKQVDLSASQQLLPYSGKYILTVYQTRNDARKQPNKQHFYNVKLSITEQNAQSTATTGRLTYRCDNGKTLVVAYQNDQAKVTWQGKEQLLKQDRKLSENNTLVFSNQAHLLSVDVIQAQDWQHSKINSWLKRGKTATDDKVLLQECVVTK